MKDTYDFDEACDYLKIKHSSMTDLLATGELPGAKISKSWVFRKIDLDAYLAEQVRIQTERRREAYQAGKGAKIKTAMSEVRKGRRRVLPDLSKYPLAA